MIRRITSRLAWQGVLASVVVFAFAMPAAAQGMITGKVVDAKGDPVTDAKITIEQTDGVTRKFETTDLGCLVRGLKAPEQRGTRRSRSCWDWCDR